MHDLANVSLPAGPWAAPDAAAGRRSGASLLRPWASTPAEHEPEGLWSVALLRVAAGDVLECARPEPRLAIALTTTRWRGGVASSEAAWDDRLRRFGAVFVPAGCAMRWHRHAPVRLLVIRAPSTSPGVDPPPSSEVPAFGVRLPHGAPLIEWLMAEIERPTDGSRDAAVALARLLWVQLLRELGRDTLSAVQLERVEALIDRRLTVAIPVSALASEAGLPMPRFARALERATGCTPHRFIVDRRLRRAMQLLHHTPDAVADVALASGFASQQHLARWMRRLVGVTPARWRAAVRMSTDA
jgi:AraC family transcriptional regulator